MGRLGPKGGDNLYQSFKNSPINKIDLLDLFSIQFDADSSMDFIERWRRALMALLQTPAGANLIRKCPGKVITIKPGSSAGGGTLCDECPGSVQLNANNPHGLGPEERSETDVLLESPPDGDDGAAVLIGHELGHAAPDYDDPENVFYTENPIRWDLGLPPRSYYHGEQVPVFPTVH